MSMNIKGARPHITLILFLMVLFGVNQAATSTALQQQDAGPVGQLNGATTEKTLPHATESLLKQVRVNSRQQAAEAAYNLAVFAAGREDLTSAQVLIEEAIQIQPSNPNYLMAAAKVAYINGKYDTAERYQLKALEIAQSILQPDDLRMAALMDELSNIYVAQSRYQDAEALLRQSLTIREQALGEMHPLVAANLNDLSGFAMQGGRFDEAENLLKQALHIFKTSSDAASPETAMAMHNLGDFYTNQKRFTEADDLYRQALATWEIAPAKYRLQLATILNDLGNFYRAKNRLDEAKPQFDLVIALLAEEFGEDHLYVSTARTGLEDLKNAREKHNEVRDYSQRLFDELQAQMTEQGPVN